MCVISHDAVAAAFFILCYCSMVDTLMKLMLYMCMLILSYKLFLISPTFSSDCIRLHLWKYFRWSWTKLRRFGIPISCKVDVVEYLVFLMNSTTFLISMVFVPQCVTVNILFTIILQVLRIALALMMQMTYTVHKTAPAGIEFLQLVEIIMEEEDWPNAKQL